MSLPSLLIIEKDENLLTELCELCELFFPCVCGVLNTQEASIQYDKKTPSVILIDINSYNIQDIQFLTDIREKNKKIKFLFLSSSKLEQNLQVQLDILDIHKYFFKPFINESFLTLISSLSQNGKLAS